MIEITANEIKTKGVSVLDVIEKDGDDAVITVKGKRKYIVIPIEKYNNIREMELEIALSEVKKDIAEGKYYYGVEEHIKRFEDV